MKRMFKVAGILAFFGLLGLLVGDSFKHPTFGPWGTIQETWGPENHKALMENIDLAEKSGELESQVVKFPMWAEDANAQTAVKIWRFRSNSGGIDTVAQDSTQRAADTWVNAKKFRIGSAATGSAALSNFTGSLQYYNNICFLLRADSLTTNDTLMCKLYTYNYQDSAFAVPFTSINSLGTPTADKESLAVSAVGRYVFSVTGMTKGTVMPMKALELRVMINATSTARCIYTVSAMAQSKAGN